jgi:hypothetical protein
MTHLTVSMAPQFYDFYLWPLRNTAWPPGGAIWTPLRTTGLIDILSQNLAGGK